jgi:general nucleoside transport system permease protein
MAVKSELAEVQEDSIKDVLLRGFKVYGVSLAVSILAISLVAALLSYDVLTVMRTLVTTSFRSSFGFQETVKKTVPLIFTALAFSIPYRIRFFNIGGVGQFQVGGISAAVVGIYIAQVHFLPSIISIPLLMACGILAGAFFGYMAAYLRAKFDINPIISTVMLNFVALQLVSFFSSTAPWSDRGEGHPMTMPLPAVLRLPALPGGIPLSLLIGIAATVFVVILMNRTRLGYEIKSVGYNLVAAQTYGINFSKTIISTFLIAGGLGGLGGALEVLTVTGRLVEGFEVTSGAQYGIFGILICLIADGNNKAIPVVAFFISILLVGADALQRTTQLPVELVFVAQAVFVIILVTVRQRMEAKS